MPATYSGVIENGMVRLMNNIKLPERTSVYVFVPEENLKPVSKFDLAELISRMPTDYVGREEGFGQPMGTEEW